ncbi:MAG: hypothetical protein M5U34_00250 [Chloroflexi bacterium]|nr:hypothetical protein [Chloroflexota bacterium]
MVRAFNCQQSSFFSVLFLSIHQQYIRKQELLSPPYFGSNTINAIFDHEYPLYSREDDNGFNGDVDTMVHRTNERLDNLAAGVVDANRYCVGYSGHDGIDYGLRYQYVLASYAGTVLEAGWDSPAHPANPACQLPANQNGQESNLAGEYWYGVSG